jgi:hypothetical protein
MKGNNAYTVSITGNTESPDEDNAVNQSSPTWVLTFVRFENRDTLRNTTISPLTTNPNDPLVVENDCVSVTTTMNKGTLTPAMEATLKETDVNYLTAVAPGDFVFVNMLNWESDARDIAIAAKNGNPINGPDDGFKGLFKVQSVRKIISVSEGDGKKNVFYKIDGYGFTEFNNTIYFNQNLLASGSQDNFGLFIRRLSQDWANIVNPNGFFNIQKIISVLITCFIGNGTNTSDLSDDFKSNLPTANVQFHIPSLVGNLLGIEQATAAKDIYSYLFGIQTYSSNENQTLAQGLNPQIQSGFKGPGFRYTTAPVYGDSFFMPEFWNATKAWSIINQYINSPLNEIYTCYRLSSDNKVYPTVVFRQMPFTTQDFKTRFNVNPSVTPFLSVPRWQIDSSVVYSLDIGRDEAARINFFQYYSRVGLINDNAGAGPAQEISAINYVFDSEDVQRSGLRPSIVSGMFDPYVSVGPRSPIWAKIMGDAVMGSQLKLNGTMELVGLIQPICIGDNLEFEGIVFHIESVIHNCNIDPISGVKRFKTILKLSNGVSLNSTSGVTYYDQMTYTNAYQDRKNDYENLDQILPGVSESQDILSRTPNVDITKANILSNSPFPQPTKPKGQT